MVFRAQKELHEKQCLISCAFPHHLSSFHHFSSDACAKGDIWMVAPQLHKLKLTLARAGGRWAPWDFLWCMPNYESDRAEIWHTLWGIFCATFGKKKFDRVMSGHGAMTSQELKCSAMFARNSGNGTLEADIEASFDYFRSELTCMTPPLYPLTFWPRSKSKSRSKSGQWPRLN